MKKEIVFGLLAAIILAMLISPFASKRPDGLERVAEDKKFIDKCVRAPVMPAVIPDYAFPGIKNERLATSLAGGLGTLMVYLIFLGLKK